MGVFKRWVTSKDGTKTAYWYIRYAVDGKQKWESVGKCGEVSKSRANEKLVGRKKMIREGRADEIDVKIPSFESFTDTYCDIQFGIIRPSSHTRLLICVKHLKNYFGIMKLSAIRPKDIDAYKRERKGKVGDGTVNRELSVLKHLFNVAREHNKFFGHNPVSIAKLIKYDNKKERILKPDEQERLLAHCNPQLKAIVLTALNTGMRKGSCVCQVQQKGDQVFPIEYAS